MNIQYFENNKHILAGTTLKDTTAFENGNLALHATNNPKKIIENRKGLATTLGMELEDFVASEQTHCTNIHKVTATDKGRGATTRATAIPETDALYTTETNILLCTLTADCVPVIFYDKTNQLIGVIHSGWQGTIKEITPKVFALLSDQEQCNPKNICVHLGPALSQEMFEVDTDVYEKYLRLGYAEEFIYYNQATNKYHIDNQKVVQKQCEMSGVPANQITLDRTCTFLSEDHFSYRENHSAGRHLSFILRKK